MKEICILVGYSLHLAPIRNRLIPIINKAIKKKFKVIIITSGTRKLDIESDLISYEFCFDYQELPLNFFKRGINEIYNSYLIMKKAYSYNSDYLIITLPYIFNLLFCKRLKAPQKQILDIRDLTWEYLESKNITQRIVKLFFRRIFKSKIRNFEAISCSNTAEFLYVNKILKNNQKVILYSNGISQNHFNDLRNLKETFNKKIIISYIGNIGVAQDLSTFVNVADKFPELIFKIVGDGKEIFKIKNLAKNKKNIVFCGKLEWNQLLEIYSQSNILYAQLRNNFSGAMPSKLYEYLSTGKYVIYGGSGEAKKILNKFNNNSVIQSNSVNELSLKISEVIKNNYYKSISRTNQDKICNLYLREKGVNNLFEIIS